MNRQDKLHQKAISLFNAKDEIFWKIQDCYDGGSPYIKKEREEEFKELKVQYDEIDIQFQVALQTYEKYKRDHQENA
jgi:hypothetical protein